MKKKSVIEGAIKCPECGKKCKPITISVSGAKVKGWRCSCGYELISPEEIEKVYLLMQAKKHEKVKISKRGNSYMITIPKAIAEAIQIEKIKIAEVFLKDEHTISVKV
ncbi:MAG: hypothetical protein JSW00_19235 [Thermoplasmata archaeon]|nr:MAG: hypothetical protein JSW00_19235 [Thermoplasmata archaeon]